MFRRSFLNSITNGLALLLPSFQLDMPLIEAPAPKPARTRRGKPARNYHLPVHSRWFPHNGRRQAARHQRQIAMGQLRRENGYFG